MGVVYRAYDKVLKTDVALKTLLDVTDPTALKLFYGEVDKLSKLVHPNIVEIRDAGELGEGNRKKPFLVMPLLQGVTLADLIRTSSERLTLERFVDIATQTCRGLHAAHEQGFVHRDLKPSNIFVLNDDSVKIIDFGVALNLQTSKTLGRKGTLHYMSPEQIMMRPLTRVSDIFSLGVVCYEALTGRLPFKGKREDEVAEAIIHHNPPPVSEINPTIPQVVSQAIHKAMAKQPAHRYSTAKEFSDILRKAFHNEPIEMFSPARFKPRLQRAKEAFEREDHQFAAEILAELSAEGHSDPELYDLSRHVEQAIKQKTISQLLESARARMEDGEFPIALQKIQQVLKLDPNHSDALALQSRVENKRTEADIVEWINVARLHISNRTFEHARQALHRVLELRPKDSQALHLVIEVDRREQEYLRLREEKERLYQAAVEAEQRKDVSSAMSKLQQVLELDRKAPELVDPSRGAIYQNLYDKVRSEHEEIGNAYSEARKHLENKDFAAALSICDQQLAKYPGQALFQALKFDAEEQQRRATSQRIAEIDSRVEAEPDLDRRVSILEEAVKANLGAPHFEKALQLVRDKRNLVESIVARARAHEEREQFSEALAHWETVRTIYDRYPALSFEIDRVSKRRVQKERIERKQYWVQRIDDSLQSSDYPNAMRLVRDALEDFPSDSEIVELEKLARSGLDQVEEAQRLLAQGQEACARDEFEEGIRQIRSAYGLDRQSPLIRAGLLEALAAHARAVMGPDKQTAENLLREALEMEPGHSVARGLLSMIADERRDEYVDECLAKARKLQGAGDCKGAYELVEEGRARFSGDERLISLQTVLARNLAEVRARDLEQVRKLRRDVEELDNTRTIAACSEQVEMLSWRWAGDPDFENEVRVFKTRLETAYQRSTVAPAIAQVQGQQPTAARQPQQRQAAGAPPGASAGPQRRTRGLGISLSALTPANRKALLAVAATVVLLVGVSIGGVQARKSVPRGGSGILVVTTSPSGASIWLKDKQVAVANASVEVSLPAGPVEIEARLPGFLPARSSATIDPGGRVPLSLNLAPEPQKLWLQGAGQVAVDSEPPTAIQDGQMSREMQAGDHSVRISVARDADVAFRFRVADGAMAELLDPLRSNNVEALVVTNSGGKARLFTTSSVMVKVDGNAIGPAGPKGLDLPELAPGSHKLQLGEGKDIKDRAIDIAAGRSLTAIVETDINGAAVIVRATEDGARVQLLSGDSPYRSGTSKEQQVRFAAVPSGRYVVRVSKDGFLPEPDKQIEVKKGQDQVVLVVLRSKPVSATLAVHTVPDAEVFLDGNVVGAASKEGTLSIPNVGFGNHSVEARRKGYRGSPVQVEVGPEASGLVALRLTRAPGVVEVRRNPANSVITYARAGDSAIHTLSGGRQELPEGTYLFIARANGYREKTATVEVAADETRTVDLTLTSVSTPAPTPAPAVKFANADWEGQGWTAVEEGWYVHKPAGFVKYKPGPIQGAITFTARWTRPGFLRGKGRLQWFVDYKDDKNYLLFELDDKGFEGFLIRNGKRTSRGKKESVKERPAYIINILLAPGRVTHRIQEDGKWRVLDDWPVSDSDVVSGRFGFLIQRGEVLMKDFQLSPGR